MKKSSWQILILSAVALISLAVFLPRLLWDMHLRQLEKTVMIQEYDTARNDTLLTPAVVSDFVYNIGGKNNTFEYPSKELPEQLEEVRNVLTPFVDACSEEDRKLLLNPMENGRLDYFSESFQMYQTESGLYTMDLVTCGLSFDDAETTHINFELVFERKTQLIVSLVIMSFNSLDEQLSDLPLDSFSAAAGNYYEAFGLGSDRFYCEADQTDVYTFGLSVNPVF